MKNENTVENIFSIRWRPDFRYLNEKLISVPLNNFNSKDPSVTDKEAYRVTLASLRGELAQGSGRPDVGSYSLKAGEEYDPSKDFSFLNRKDLTIVELDEFIKFKKAQLEEMDAEVNENIKKDLAKAEKMKQSMEKETVNKNNNVGE